MAKKKFEPITLEKARYIMNKKHDTYRFQHVCRVTEQAVKLARIHGIDDNKVALAGMLHDYAKGEDNHDKAGALLVNRELGINDPEILEAIRTHYVGGKKMGPVAKCVFIADASEEGRIFGNTHIIDEILLLAKTDLDSACEQLMTEIKRYKSVRDKMGEEKNDVISSLGQ
ncbi:MAG: HD domain-containing protein [Peptostreptococcaceae bacterium]